MLRILPITLILSLVCQCYSYRYNGTKRLRSKSQDIFIGGIFPMSGAWAGGQGCLPAVMMALDRVNSREDILPGYHLTLFHNDSQCNPGLGTTVAYELLYNEPTKIMLLTGCSQVSTAVAEAARMWNLIVLSYGSSSPALSNRKRFPTFFRTHPSATINNPTRVRLFNKWGWTRIATIQETQEVFTSTVEDLEQRLSESGIEISIRQSFLTDPTNAVRNLKRQDARIIVGVFYEDMARRVFCQVYKEKLYGKKYVWFIIGWYRDDWFLVNDTSVNCTKEQMQEAVEGHITTEAIFLNPDPVVTTTGITARDFQLELNAVLKNNQKETTGYVEAPLAYDAVWALAFALNKTMNRLKERGETLHDFKYDRKDIADEIYSAMNSTDFVGVSGRVAFSAAGDRIAWTQIEQMIGGNYGLIGHFDASSNNLSWLNKDKWIAGKPPADRTQIDFKLRRVSLGLFISMCALASIGILCCIACMIFNCVFKNDRLIRYSHPEINSLTAFGCIVCLFAVFLLGLDGQHVAVNNFGKICQANVWILSIGFTFAYGAMFSKIWRVHRISTRQKKDKKTQVESWKLWIFVVILLIIDVIVFTTWQIIDPLEREEEKFPREEPENSDEDIMIEPFLEHCKSKKHIIWIGVIYGYKGLLLVLGVFLAYETRNMKVDELNDTRFVGMSIYNVVVLCLITAPVTLIISSQQDATYAFSALAIIFCCFLSLGMIFIPKVMHVRKNIQTDGDISSVAGSSVTREEEEKLRSLLTENEDLKRQISDKEERIRTLNDLLRQKGHGHSSSSSSSAAAARPTRAKHISFETPSSSSSRPRPTFVDVKKPNDSGVSSSQTMGTEAQTAESAC